jgi:hypothetical protein
MNRKSAFKHFVALALIGTALPALAHGPVATQATAAQTAKLQADRTNILAMAGTFKVTFDFREQTAWQADYTPIAPKVSGGHEVVRVIEDSGRRIVLQHILLVENEGKVSIVKHWRQDWVYEPASVLVYAGVGQWNLEAVPATMQHGRWSQTVWQTDDSPRYGGWGEWSNEGGVSRWRSNWTWRPLARRDAVRHPVYDRYMAINRHSTTPTGWIHWQDNIKMGMRDGKLVPFVQEAVLNTYAKSSDFNIQRADDYWAKTKDYWAAIRAEWNAIILRNQGIHVTEVAESGSATGSTLMELADDIEAGKVTTPAAIAKARALMDDATKLASKP